jgi:single-stranded DNA-binding protein
MIEFNKVIITGHLSATPTLREDRSGHKFCKGELVNRRSWITPDRQEHEEENLLPFIAWGQVGELIAHQGHAGDLVLLEGRLKRESWYDSKYEEVKTDSVISATFFQTISTDERN